MEIQSGGEKMEPRDQGKFPLNKGDHCNEVGLGNVNN